MGAKDRLPDYPPLYAPAVWWRAYTRSLLAGAAGEEEATAHANRQSGLRPRDWMRFRLEGDTRLSLPTEGGASSLKNRPAATWTLSREAGRESRKARATLATLYGRQPYFHLLEAELTAPLVSAEEGTTARKICTDAHRAASIILGLDDRTLLDDLRQRIAGGDRLLRATAAELTATAYPPDRSILESLFRLGPDAIFTLLPTF